MEDAETFLKYGGVKFRAKADAETINRFVRQLPDGRRESLFEVAGALRDAGLIELADEFTTIDRDLEPYLRGKPGPDDTPPGKGPAEPGAGDSRASAAE